MPSEHEVRELVRAAVEALNEPSHEVSPSESPSGPMAIAVDPRVLLADVGHLEEVFIQPGPLARCEPVDYPEFAHAVARMVADGTCTYGVIVDGAGIGSCMVANKVPGIRAALCYDLSTARNSREHNHANVLTLGAGLIGTSLAMQIVDEWLATEWGPGRHERRVELITEIDRRYRV